MFCLLNMGIKFTGKFTNICREIYIGKLQEKENHRKSYGTIYRQKRISFYGRSGCVKYYTQYTHACMYNLALLNIKTLTSSSRLINKLQFLRSSLYAAQQRSVNFWKLVVGVSPPLITYAISGVRTNGALSLL